MFRYRSAAVTLAALAILVSGALTAPANAENRTVTDDYNGSAFGLNVKCGTFSHRENAAVIRVRFADLSRRNTVLATKYLRRDGVTIQVVTLFRHGQKVVRVHRFTIHGGRRLSSRHVQVEWDFRTDVIRVRIARPLLRGDVADFLSWSQPKGAQHGDHSGRDGLYVGRLRRG